MKKVILTQPLHEDAMKILKDNVNIKVTNNGNPKQIESDLVDADAIIVRMGWMDHDAIMSAKNLKVIARQGVGYDSIDINAANEKGIPVVITPGANKRSVAEHTLALILALAKDLRNYDRELRQGSFGNRTVFKAFELYGKSLGLIGFGNIGREVAELCSALGLNISVFDPYVKQEVVNEYGYTYVENLDELLKTSDIVSVHIPLSDKTRGLIDSDKLKLMKPDSIIINCARGGIIDETDLVEALEQKWIKGAALDVFSTEPLPPDSPLLKLDNIIVTPHTAALTEKASSNMGKMVVEGVLSVLRGEKWPHIVNKEVYNHPIWKDNT